MRSPRRAPARRLSIGAAIFVVAVSTLTAPTAAYAAGVDLEVSVGPASLSGTAGDSRQVSASILNNSATSGSGVATIHFSLAGSNITALYADTPGGSCDIATATCSFADVPAYDVVSVSATLLLASSGSLTAIISQAGAGDPVSGNDTSTVPIAVSALPLPPAPAVLVLTATPHPVAAGAPVHLSAKLTTSDGAALSDEFVAILAQPPGATTFATVGGVYTDSAGAASMDAYPTASTAYKAQFTGGFSGTAGAAESASVQVRVTYAVTAAASPVTVPPGSVAMLSIVVGSGTAGSPITIQQRIGSGPWKSIGHPNLVKGGKAQLRITTLDKVGSYLFRAIRGADATHDQGIAQARIVVTTTGKGDKNAWQPLAGTKARPGRWNPCAPIVYYVNPRHMPANGLPDLREAMRRVSLAGGLTFHYGGTQNVVPTPGYHGPASGILIAWSTTAETKGLLPSYADGLGGGGRTFGQRIVSGYVIIDANSAKPGAEPPGFGAGSPQGLVLMHELGHVVGLDHVNDPWSIMQPGSPLPASVWGAGDISGLRALGRPAGCL